MRCSKEGHTRIPRRRRKDGSWKHYTVCAQCSREAVKRAYRSRKQREPDFLRRSHTMERYGITWDQRAEMLRSQGGLCLVCDSTITGRNIHLDHCHGCNKLRGLLCSTCNTSLGILESKKFNRLVKYAEPHRACR